MSSLEVLWVALMMFVVGFVGGSWVGMNNVEERMQREAIEYGCAEYNTQTGEWGWK